MKNLLLLINPVTAKTAITPSLIEVIDIFERAGYNTVVHITQKRGDIPSYLRDKEGIYDTVVCVGGDGTLNETVQGIFNFTQKPSIGYIPAGTTNDFATSWGIPKDPIAVATKIAEESPVYIDINLFCGKPYVYVAAFGMFTDISYKTPQQMKQNLGYAAYLFEALLNLGNLGKPVRLKVEHDGIVETGDYLYGMVANTRRVGGIDLKVKNSISISDGLMEVILIRASENPIESPRVVGAVLAQDMQSEYIHFAQTTKIKLTSDTPVPWTLDGEHGGDLKEVTVEVVKNAVKMFI